MNKEKNYGIAIDIGTTNIVMMLVDLHRKKSIAELTEPNVNARFGKDVMSRITHACRGRLREMSDELRAQLDSMIGVMTASECYDVERIVIACNTVMTHILLSEDCTNLGKYPFSPVHVSSTDVMSTDIRINCLSCPVHITAGFSAYVGGDVRSGLDYINLPKNNEINLFVDMGTNAEIVLSDGKKNIMYVTSAAAGPAFEMAGPEHASDYISKLYELKKNGIVDETGLLSDKYFETGYEGMTQNRIRTIQSAKAAIRAGMDIILNKCGIDASVIDSVYVAGVFGLKLDIDAAIGIGLLREEWKTKVVVVGNTSLNGAVKKLLSSGDSLYVESIDFADEIYLSNEPEFEQLYLDNMYL